MKSSLHSSSEMTSLRALLENKANLLDELVARLAKLEYGLIDVERLVRFSSDEAVRNIQQVDTVKQTIKELAALNRTLSSNVPDLPIGRKQKCLLLREVRLERVKHLVLGKETQSLQLRNANDMGADEIGRVDFF